MLITRTSEISFKTRTKDIDITEEQLLKIYNSNELIQNICPHLSDSDREFLITGITDEEWDESMKILDDELSEESFDEEDAF